MMTSMDAVIYARVSQDHGTRSVQEQERECREFCDRQGWNVTRVLTDNDIGASRYSGKDRPAYRELKEILRPGDVLVTWEASRAQRDLAAYVELRNLCADRGVKWAYNGRVFDLSDGDDRFGTGLDALLAEKEAEQIRARVLRGKRSAAAEGRPSGKTPPGYRPVRDPRTGRTVTWEPDEVAPVMQEAARRILAGETLRAVTRWANEHGMTGTHRQMRDRLHLASYAGLRVHQGKVVGEANWPALWSPEQRDQIIAAFADPARRASGGGGVPVRHLLAGIARCGVCGAGMRHYWPPSAQKISAPPAYVCSDGLHVRRQAKPLEKAVVRATLARMRKIDRAQLADDGGAAATAARKEAQELQNRLDEFTVAAAEPGGPSPRALAAIEQKLQPQIDAALARARASYRSPLIGRLVENPEDWKVLTVVERREVIRSMVTVRVMPTQSRGVAGFRREDVEIHPV